METGCPICTNSKGEDRILSWVEGNFLRLKETGIIGCTPEKKFSDCKDKRELPFDFGFEYFDSTWSVAEYQGKQHFFPVEFFGGKKAFKEQQKKDKIKKKYCKDNNISLLIIPYWEFDNIEKILKEALL